MGNKQQLSKWTFDFLCFSFPFSLSLSHTHNMWFALFSIGRERESLKRKKCQKIFFHSWECRTDFVLSSYQSSSSTLFDGIDGCVLSFFWPNHEYHHMTVACQLVVSKLFIMFDPNQSIHVYGKQFINQECSMHVLNV